MSDMDFPAFAVACGEEGSDPLVLHEGQVVRVDQYRASSHLEHLDSDLADVAGLGVAVWRYGMPWRETETAPGVFDWTLWDRALEACRRHGLDPMATEGDDFEKGEADGAHDALEVVAAIIERLHRLER